MKKLTVLSIAALSLGTLYAADPQPDATPQPPAADQAPKPLPPLDQSAQQGPGHRKWMMKHGGPGLDQRDKGGPNKGLGQRGQGGGKFAFRGQGDQKFGGRPAPDRGAMLADTLQLTPDQRTKAKAIMLATRPKLQAIQQEARDKSRAVIEESMKELRPLLTPEQQAVFDDLQKLQADRSALDLSRKPANAAPAATPAPSDTKNE